MLDGRTYPRWRLNFLPLNQNARGNLMGPALPATRWRNPIKLWFKNELILTWYLGHNYFKWIVIFNICRSIKKLLKMFFSKKMLKKIRRLRKNNNNNFNSSGTTTSGIERRIYFLDFLWDQKTNNWILFSPINFRIPTLFCHRKTEKPKNRKTEKPKNRKNGPPLLFFFSIKSKMTKGDELGIGWNFFFSRSVAKDSLDWIIKQILISFQFYQFLMGQWL